MTCGLGGTGVVGTLKVGKGEKSLGLRADMDALPMSEAEGCPYVSRHAGVMHACAMMGIRRPYWPLPAFGTNPQLFGHA